MVESVPIALQIPWRQANKILPATGTNLLTIAAGGITNAGLAPTKVFAVIASNNDTIVFTSMESFIPMEIFIPIPIFIPIKILFPWKFYSLAFKSQNDFVGFYECAALAIFA
jgi:hypothetical protein